MINSWIFKSAIKRVLNNAAGSQDNYHSDVQVLPSNSQTQYYKKCMDSNHYVNY